MNRQFIPKEFTITVWEKLQPFFSDLEKRNINSANDLEKWLKDYNELGAVVSENMAWRYIKMTCDTANTDLRNSFNDFVQNIEPIYNLTVAVLESRCKFFFELTRFLLENAVKTGIFKRQCQGISLLPFDPGIKRLLRFRVVNHRLVEIGDNIACVRR